MKHTMAVLLLILSVLVAAQAQNHGPSQGTDAVAQTLTGLENKWVGALAKPDTATLDSILSDTYVDTDEHGQRSDKQECFQP